MSLIYIFIGGGTGALLRFLTSQFVNNFCVQLLIRQANTNLQLLIPLFWRNVFYYEKPELLLLTLRRKL